MVEQIPNNILRIYKTLPVIVSHYDITSTIKQKIEAILSRRILQARDIFDLYILSTQYVKLEKQNFKIKDKLNRISELIFELTFEQFRDTVLSYLSDEEKQLYSSAKVWDEVKLKVVEFLEELSKDEE